MLQKKLQRVRKNFKYKKTGDFFGGDVSPSLELSLAPNNKV